MYEKYELYFFEQLSKLVYMNPTFIRRIYSYNCLSTNWPDTLLKRLRKVTTFNDLIIGDSVNAFYILLIIWKINLLLDNNLLFISKWIYFLVYIKANSIFKLTLKTKPTTTATTMNKTCSWNIVELHIIIVLPCFL